MLLTLVILTASLGAAISSSNGKEETYSQPYSTRYYYEKAAPKLVAPFQRVKVNPPKNICSNKMHTFLLTDDFKVNVLHTDGTVVDTGISTTGSSITPSTDGFVLCTTNLCTWYTCNEEDSSCTAGNTFAHPLGKIFAVATDLYDDSVWVAGADSGLLRISKKGTFQAVTSIAGNVTTIEVNSRRVAVGTTLGRYTNLFSSVIPYCNSHNQRHVLTIHYFFLLICYLTYSFFNSYHSCNFSGLLWIQWNKIQFMGERLRCIYGRHSNSTGLLGRGVVDWW